MLLLLLLLPMMTTTREHTHTDGRQASLLISVPITHIVHPLTRHDNRWIPGKVAGDFKDPDALEQCYTLRVRLTCWLTG